MIGRPYLRRWLRSAKYNNFTAFIVSRSVTPLDTKNAKVCTSFSGSNLKRIGLMFSACLYNASNVGIDARLAHVPEDKCPRLIRHRIVPFRTRANTNLDSPLESMSKATTVLT